jgi:hypothetical protein
LVLTGVATNASKSDSYLISSSESGMIALRFSIGCAKPFPDSRSSETVWEHLHRFRSVVPHWLKSWLPQEPGAKRSVFSAEQT